MAMGVPTIKKISKNGQLGLSKKYGDTYVQYWEDGNRIIIEPLFWDADLGTWMTKAEHTDISGETVWSATADNASKGLPLDKIFPEKS